MHMCELALSLWRPWDLGQATPVRRAAHAARAPQGAQAHDIRVSIAPNPSHLEAVGPVVMGLVRALQHRLGASGQQRVLGLLVHGDAAFAGLGIVPECLQLSTAPGDPSGLSARLRAPAGVPSCHGTMIRRLWGQHGIRALLGIAAACCHQAQSLPCRIVHTGPGRQRALAAAQSPATCPHSAP